MRSPLAYPLTRPVDGDAGGAADLQTDVMRFMAILALCLVAIFALVQSLPLGPAPAPAPPVSREPVTETVSPQPESAAPVAEPAPANDRIVLTRSRWTPRFEPAEEPVPEPAPEPVPPPANPATPERGFTLAFESDLALTRLVAAGRIGFYAIGASGARRMSVSDGRVSFWNASTPNSFHEMEAQTVPQPVVSALEHGGAGTGDTQWGVTLPADMRRDLDALLARHTSGDITIHADGSITLGEKE